MSPAHRLLAVLDHLAELYRELPAQRTGARAAANLWRKGAQIGAIRALQRSKHPTLKALAEDITEVMYADWRLRQRPERN